MKKFTVKITVTLVFILTIYGILGFLADGYTDPFYLRFTSTKQQSLILGTSRAAQGIRPQIVDSVLERKVGKSIYNFSFTLLDSPYGETYYNAIQSKLDNSTKDGLFIVTVDPWSVSSRNDFSYEIESKKVLGKLTFFNMNPNYDYLIHAYNQSVFSILLAKFKKKPPLFLHKDGWLEVSVSMDSLDINKRVNTKISDYKTNLTIYKISENRINWLARTIDLLNNYGNVILVRIPVGNQILAIEDQLYKPFDSLMISRFKNIPYLNFVNDGKKYQFVDGNHLYKKSAKHFSIALAKQINKMFLDE
ncbi:hypothetical protein [Winogradskyella sp.]|uniref:hypothetical protein n=1 Tax=Winogradskyella sp. TaxID=1883156 RepID=UPI003AB8C4B0